MPSVALLSPAPPYFDALRGQYHPLTRQQVLPRLSLLALEAVTAPAWDVQILDERVDEIVPDSIAAPIVGITTMTHMAPRAFALARKLKACGKTVVLGGFFPTLTPELALAEQCIDAIVIGRGERIWPQLLSDFHAGTLQRTYRDTEITPDFHLPRINHALTTTSRGYNGWLTQVQTSLGCKFHCRFCAVPQFYHRKFALRNIDDVTHEVAAAPTRCIFFVDDNLLNYPDYLARLCDRLRTTGKKWSAQLSMDIRHHNRLLKIMRQSGCFWVHVGIETLDPAALAAQEKNQNKVQHYLDTLSMIHDAGISVSAGMVFGFPNESAGVFDQTAQFLSRANLDAVSFHYYTPFPGSPDHAALTAAGQLVTRDLACYDTYHAVVHTKNYTPEALTCQVESLKRAFYRPTQVLTRGLRGLRHGPASVMRTLAAGTMGYLNCRQGLPLHP